MTRLAPIAVLLAAFVLAPLRSAVPEEVSRDDGPQLPEVRELSEGGVRAIKRGLAWLAAKQQRDGSWIANVGYKLNEGYIVTKEKCGHPGVTALAGMAFLAGGHLPGRGMYGENVKRAVDYIIKCVQPDGMISANNSRMYSHAFGTLFLAEVYGMTRDAKVKKALQRSAQFTWKCQNQTGGWRYAPYAQDSDMSITVCQVMALRAARNIGIKVPKESIDRAVNYVIESANVGRGEQPGSFKYQYRKHDQIPTRDSFALTAAGLATLYMAGLYTDRDILDHIREHRIERFRRAESAPRIKPILEYIRTRYGSTRKRHYFFYYGNYYAVQAMFIAGGKWWEEYFERVQRDLVADQREDGSWPIARVGDTFSTSAACLILQIPYRYLPIFSR